MRKTVLLLFTAALFAACHSGNNKSWDSILDCDSLSSIETSLIEPERLGDTVYESAKSIDYKIIVEDTLISGELTSLRDLYEATPGGFTFRKGSLRQGDFGGKVDKYPSDIRIDWTFKTAESFSETNLGKWGGGTGWSGQPVYVEWPDSLLKKMKDSGAVFPDFTGKEIIFGSLCGNLYFVDQTTGQPSRKEIGGKNPVKGSISLDPTLNGNLYVGEGVAVERPWGVYMVDLFTNHKEFLIPEDPKAWRHWGAFDSSSLRVGQFQFFPAENGSIYKYYVGEGIPKLHSVLRYRINGAAPGIESSMAAYSNYGIVCDNHGNIIALNLDNLKPIWLYNIGDDTDATPVIAQEEGGEMVIYVGCEIDRQGVDGIANFVKIALKNGKEIWKSQLPGKRFDINDKHFDGGYYASPLIGTGNCKDRIYALCVRNTKGQNGELVAFERSSGRILFQTPLKHYAWSSPVAFLTPDGRMVLFVADCRGNVYLIDGQKGDIIMTKQVGANFESSPVVMNNSLVVGSRGNSIFKLTLE